MTNPEGPVFLAHQRMKLRNGRIEAHGVAESWVAPVAVIDAPDGFGEEVWMASGPDSVIAWQLSGADVVCEFGRFRGQRARSGQRKIAMQPKGMPNHFRAGGRIRFAQFYLPDRLVARVATDLGITQPGPGALRDDLIFFGDEMLHRFLSDYAARASSFHTPPTRVEMEARAVLIVERLLSEHHVRPQVNKKGGLAAWRVKRVTEYLLENLAEDIALADLAEIAGLSPHHFCRAFSQTIGMPPYAWLTAQRIERAKELMGRRPEMGLTEIALCVGYSSQAAFGTSFRRATGLTPGRWRREMAA